MLDALHQIAARHGVSYFLIGATARDILMTHVFGLDPGRATRDVDFAVALEDWSQFETIKQAFVDSGNFQSTTNEAHRLYYQPGNWSWKKRNVRRRRTGLSIQTRSIDGPHGQGGENRYDHSCPLC